ncbi:hypothetical protein ACS6JN_25280, partial [Enterobacter hormaechei subsp. steigerwaltii]|uniref:hypothetical protein n=1 Tax=Enterobacter hormaechei TaxID=158836 RepID=UPI003F444F9B
PAIHRWRRVTFEPYGPYPWHYGNFIGFSKPVDGIEDEYYYAAPPAPVSVPAAKWMMTLTARLNTEKLSAGTPIAQPCFSRSVIPNNSTLRLFRMVGWLALSGCLPQGNKCWRTVQTRRKVMIH